jgi:hypothetical protein
MKKLNLKLSAALLTVVLLATAAYIFYACKKDGNSNSDKNLKKETEFVAKIHEKMCVQVNVFRDENDNVHITTKEVGIDPTKSIAVIVPEALSMESQLSKNDESIVIEIPNDAVYWLVPLDGNEPVKFEPVNDTKSASGSSGSITVYCVCTQDRQDCTSGSKCQPPKYIQNEK